MNRFACLLLAAACPWSAPGAAEPWPAPPLTQTDVQPHYFSLPAPRGQILDAAGRPLARTVTVRRLLLRVPRLEVESPEAFASWVKFRWPALKIALPMASMPSEEAMRDHFTHRRLLPLAISPAFRGDVSLPERLPDQVEVQVEYRRDYPQGSLAAHVLGYVSAEGAPLRGPLHAGEPLWMEVKGREGLEASFDRQLTGRPGLLLMQCAAAGQPTRRHVIEAPRPGEDVVTTLRLDIQRAAETALSHSGRPGAMVVMDASTGDVLALASGPTFNPNAFAAGISSADFETLTSRADHPLYPRATSSQYPPGSIFKPFVALAGLWEGSLAPDICRHCGPELEIDGRLFRNWTTKEDGWFDLRAALVRSCNTYFYQVGLDTGDRAILRTARLFGFGEAPRVPLAGVAAGSLPAAGLPAQAVANLSIGQGEVLASPLQAAAAMAAVANGRCRPRVRLVTQVQDREGRPTEAWSAVRETLLPFTDTTLNHVRDAMNGVVNHRYGTAGKARLETVRVYGKTGTAQWSHGGKPANAVWFAGYVLDCEPPISFAVALEGREDESILAGSTAAPVAGEALAKIFAGNNSASVVAHRSRVSLEEYPLCRTDAMVAAENLPVEPTDADTFVEVSEPVRLAPTRRRETFTEPSHETIPGFFRRLFGRR